MVTQGEMKGPGNCFFPRQRPGASDSFTHFILSFIQQIEYALSASCIFLALLGPEVKDRLMEFPFYISDHRTFSSKLE